MEFLLRQNENWKTATPAELLTWLTTETIELKSNRLNANDLMKLLGTETANNLAGVLEATGLKLVVYSLATKDGIDFGDPETQRMLDVLSQNPAFAPVVDMLKAFGQDRRTRWARFSKADLPTEQEIVNVLTLAKSNDAKAVLVRWRNDILMPIVDAAINEGRTIDKIKSEIALL